MFKILEQVFSVLSKKDKHWLILMFLSMLLAAMLEVVSIGSVPVLISLVASPEKFAEIPLVGSSLRSLSSTSSRELLLWGSIGFLVRHALWTKFWDRYQSTILIAAESSPLGQAGNYLSVT